MSYFERYQAGEHLPVWRDINDIPWYSLQHDPSYMDTLADVIQVVRETMARVKQNINLLIPRLQSLGYEFGYGWVGLDNPENPWADSDRLWVEHAPPLLSPPLPDLNERFERFRQHVGYVPLSLQAFYEVVGGVNLVGTLPPRWRPCLESLPAVDYSILDPLVIEPLDDDLIEASIETKKLYISPDEYTKYNISGAEPYHIKYLRPHHVTDGLCSAGWLQMRFVDYLRTALSWGGMPGIARLPKRPDEDIAILTTDLLPF